MAKYRPVDQRVWSDRRFLALSDDGRLLWLFLLTCPSSTPIPGLILGGDAALAEQLGWTAERFRKGFQEVFREGFKVARESRIVWLKNGLKYQPAGGPNAMKCWAGSWDDIPEGPLKREIWEALRTACKSWSVLFGKLFPEPLLDSLENPLPNPSGRGSTHEHEHEHEHEQEREHARAIPQSTELTPAPSPRPPQSFAARDLAAAHERGHLAEATWQRLSELRVSHAAKLKLAGILPLPTIAPSNHPRGFRELLERIREEGDLAREACDHVLRVLDDQARDSKSIEWLDEKAFTSGAWNKARSTPLSKRKPAAAAPERPAPIAPENRAGPDDFAAARAVLGIAKEPA